MPFSAECHELHGNIPAFQSVMDRRTVLGLAPGTTRRYHLRMFRKPFVVSSFVAVLVIMTGILVAGCLSAGTPPPSSQRKVNGPQRLVTRQLAAPKPLGEPIAYGTSNDKGRNSGNYTCTFDKGTYHISVAGLTDYSPERYIVFVTPYSPYSHHIMFFDLGQKKDGPDIVFSSTSKTGVSVFFQFIIFRMPE